MNKSRKTISILLMLMMVVTTLAPTWAFGAETGGDSAASVQQDATGDADASGAEKSSSSEVKQTQETKQAEPVQKTKESSAVKTDSKQDASKPAEHFAVITAKGIGTKESKDAPYLEAGIVIVQKDKTVSVKKDELTKKDADVYQAKQNLNDNKTVGYSDGHSYAITLKNYLDDKGNARDGYQLNYVDLNGYQLKISEINADKDHHIQIAHGKIADFDGDADAFIDPENGQDLVLAFSGETAFSQDLKVTFAAAQDDAKTPAGESAKDNAQNAADQANALSAEETKVAAADVQAAAANLTALLAANDSHENQVHVIVENTTYTKADGAPWDGTLVDTWVDLSDDSTMMSCFLDALKTVNGTQSGADAGYISEINGLSAFDGGSSSGWMGTLNDWFTNEGFGGFTVASGTLKAGDEIRIMYTCDYGGDLGGSWENNEKTVKNIAVSAGTLNPAFDKETHEYMLTVPEETKSVLVTPTATNKNYQVRTSIGDQEYGRSDQIPVKDGTKITVKCGDPSWPTMNDNSDPAQVYTITVKQEQSTTVQAKVTASLQQENYYIMMPKTLTVDSGLAESYGYKDSVDPAASVSALDVLVRMHEVMLESEFTPETKDDYLAVSDSGWITTLMGADGSSTSFAINGAYPYDPDSEYGAYGYKGYAINQAPVKNGDSMDVFFYQDVSFYMDYYTWFEQNGSRVDSITAEVNKEVTLNLQGLMYAFCGPLTKEDAIKQGGLKALEDIQLTLVDPETGDVQDLKGAVTDEDGNVTVSFSKAGTYYLSAYGDEYTPIVSPWLKVTVTGTDPTPEKTKAKLTSLTIHSDKTLSEETVLVKNQGDSYKNGTMFSSDVDEYTLAAQTDLIDQLGFKAAADKDATITVYYGDGQSQVIANGSDDFAQIKCLEPGKNTFSIKVEPKNGSDQEATSYLFTVDCLPTLTGLTAKAGTAELPLDKTFAAATGEYILTVPESAETIEFDATPRQKDYTLKYNGESSSSVNIKGKDKVEITVAAGSDKKRTENTYTVKLDRVKQLDLTVNVTPKNAIVKIYDGEGNEVETREDGSYTGEFSNGKYTYVVTKYGYVAQTGKVPEAGGELSIELEKAADDGLADVDSDWDNFRGSDNNMGITDAMTPSVKEDTTLLWNRKLGSGWMDAPSVQIIADNALIVMVGSKIYKLDLKTGETLKEGTMAGSPSYSYTPPTYAEGMIFVPLGNGTIQAFNAKTLESLWVYKDKLGGQALSPITYSNGYIYTGFWNSETKDAHYVCLSVTDENVKKTDEAKNATWVHTQAGGYYWAGSVAVGSYIIVGSDDGVGSGSSGDSVLTVYDQETGKIVSQLKLEGAGDQRSSIAYDKDSGRIYFTTKGGYLCSAEVNAETGKLSNLKKVNYNAQSTSTPVVYKGKVYFATGSGITSTGSSGNVVVADADTLKMEYAVGLKGYPQCSLLLSTAYEKQTGYIYLYATYNANPGGISMIKVKPDATSAKDAELIELYDAKGFEQYCISSIICDKNGTLYYKNDSGNIFAVGLPDYKTVRNLIDKIGEVTLESKTDIENARKAYEALSDENKEKVDNYDKLVAAEKKLKELEDQKKAEEEKKNSSKDTPKETLNPSGTTFAPSGTTRSITKKATIKLGKMTSAAKNVVSKLDAVVKAGLPKNAKEYTDDQIKQITEAYKAYNALSVSEKKAVEATDTWDAFSEITQNLASMYHYDEATGIDVRSTKEENLPWYIKLVVTPKKLGEKQRSAVTDVLGEESEVFALYDIHFINTLDNSEWHPTGLIRVKMPMISIGNYKTPVIVHIADNGKIRIIEGHVDSAAGTIEFEASDFSLYGIAGSDQSIDSLLGAQAAADIMPWILAGAAAAAVLIILLIVRKRRNKREFYE